MMVRASGREERQVVGWTGVGAEGRAGGCVVGLANGWIAGSRSGERAAMLAGLQVDDRANGCVL